MTNQKNRVEKYEPCTLGKNSNDQMCVTGDPEVVKKKKKWGDRKKRCFKKQWLKFFRILVELTHKSKSIADS